jgi:hypothetical protein
MEENTQVSGGFPLSSKDLNPIKKKYDVLNY